MNPLIRLAILVFALTSGAIGAEQRDPARWEKNIASLEAKLRAAPPPADPVLFIGSSSFVRWVNLAADFPRLPVINHGFGGSMMSDSVYYFDRLVKPVRPRIGVVYAGGNDLGAGKTPEEVAADARAFAAKWHAELPTRKLIFTAIQLTPARWAIRDKIALTNTYLAAFCAADPRRVFMDLSSALLTPSGEARPELYVPDRLHLNADGYKIWVGLLAPVLE